MVYQDCKQKYMNQAEMLGLLHKFANSVGDKYKKLPYQIWRNFEREVKIHDCCCINFYSHLNFKESEISIVYSSKDYTFKVGDNSFGSFLYDELFKEGNVTVRNIANEEVKRWVDSAISSPKEGLYNQYIDYNHYLDKDGKIWEYVSEEATDHLIKPLSNGNIANATTDSIVSKLDTGISYASDYLNREEIEELIDKKINNKNEKEKNTMKNLNFDFGPCNDDRIHMSMYGMALKNSVGTWVAYNANTGDIFDVDVLNFNAGRFFYKMPVAIKDIHAGDVVIHNNRAMFVKNVKDKTVNVIDVYDGDQKNILITKNMFGFDFCTKIVSLFGNMTTPNATADNPFGNMLPLLMLNDSTGKKDFDPLMLFMLMGNNGNTQFNPMMLALLMDGKSINGNDDLVKTMLMAQAFGNSNMFGCNTPAVMPVAE